MVLQGKVGGCEEMLIELGLRGQELRVGRVRELIRMFLGKRRIDLT